MFRRLHESGETLVLTIDGRRIEAPARDTVAAVLLAEGITSFRTTARSRRPRAAYCGMGVCFECLVTIDGVANQQACLTPVRRGMVIITGSGPPDDRDGMPS